MYCKVIFFWDPSQDMSSSDFPPKNSPLIGRPDRSANQRPVFWRETTWIHVLILISEKTDFSNTLLCKNGIIDNCESANIFYFSKNILYFLFNLWPFLFGVTEQYFNISENQNELPNFTCWAVLDNFKKNILYSHNKCLGRHKLKAGFSFLCLIYILTRKKIYTFKSEECKFFFRIRISDRFFGQSYTYQTFGSTTFRTSTLERLT